MDETKPVSLEAMLKMIEEQHGTGTIQKLESTYNFPQMSEMEMVPSGSLGLDIALGVGGLPKKRIIEIFGPEASGKTTLALSIISQAQKQGGYCAFIDVEHALDPVWAKKIGVKTEELLFSQPDSAEEALELTSTLVSSGHMSVIVIDSVAALVPRTELEGGMGDTQIGLQARLMSHALRKLTGIISKSNTLVIFINQIRMKIGVLFGSPETTSGGTALKYSSSIRLDVRRVGLIKSGDDTIGSTIRVKVTKNKVAPPYKQAEFDIFFNRGLSREGEIIDLAVKEEIIKKSGSWYLYPSSPSDPNPIKLGQGRDKARHYLEKDPLVCQKIEQEIRKRCLFQHLKSVDPSLLDEVDGEEEELELDEFKEKVEEGKIG